MAEPFTEAKERWIASMEARVRDRSNPPSAMAPWDEMAFFQPVKTSSFSSNPGVIQQVATSNSARVGLIFANPSSVTVRLTVTPNVAGLFLIDLPTLAMPWVILQKDLGILCQSEWFASVPLMGNLTVYEILLKEFNS